MTIQINAYCTHINPPELTFPHTLNVHANHNDGSEFDNYLNGFQGYILENGGEGMNMHKYHVFRHIQRVNHQFIFDVEDENLNDALQWAIDSNAVLLFTDGTVRLPSGELLFDPENEPDESYGRIPFLQESYLRRARTEEILNNNQVPLPSLPPLPCELELNLRTEQEMIERALALFIVTLRAESLGENTPIDVEQIKDRLPEGMKYLTPLEESFLFADSNEEQEILQFSWRYEALHTLLWALGLIPELAFPSEICDVPRISQIMLNWDDSKKNIKCKKTADVLDALDLHYALHWHCRQADIDEVQPAASIEYGVIMERHHAFNWLIFFENAEWDEVSTPT